MATESFNDFDTFADWGTEMLETHREVALVNIVRTYTIADQLVHQFFHYMYAVVYATQQYGLVAQWNACVGQSCQSCFSFGSHLVGMVEVGVKPYRVVFLEHVYQIVGDALGAYNGGTASQTDNLNMFDGTQTRYDVFQFLVRNAEAIATREEIFCRP